MRCAWQEYLHIIPHWMRSEVDKQGRDSLQELRLRIGKCPELVFQTRNEKLNKTVTREDIDFVINIASSFSPWTASTIADGFITSQGGHRIGICGACVIKNGTVCGISHPNSLCIRVARDFDRIAETAANRSGSILILGPPGSGKTTLLRDLIRCKSNIGTGSIAVVDERQELFPIIKGQACFPAGDRTDILSGVPKANGVEMVLRSMSPEWIAVDEITASEDCEVLLHAGWCGVNLIATAHAGSVQDLRTRPVYQPLVKYGLFSNIIVLQKDKSWKIERMNLCH